MVRDWLVAFRRHDLHTLTGSYALDALDGLERGQFERHLRRCPSCAAEVGELRETVTRLAMTAAVRPRGRLREKVLAAARDLRQGTLVSRFPAGARGGWPGPRGPGS